MQDKGYAYQGGDYDIHDQPANNYAYDAIGNLIKDSIEKINKINWNVYGKITEIDHSSVPNPSYNPVKNIYYFYDAAGNRIGKKSNLGNSATVNYTWYVRDASGNVMSSYTSNADSSSGLTGITAKLENNYLYGSSRLGMYARGFTVDAQDNALGAEYTPWGGSDFNFYRGGKQYELSNHLGNVIVTINDIKLGTPLTSNSSLIDHYNAFAIMVSDYYPFGMQIPGRSYNTSLYRYGFNGKENDNEVKGIGNQVDYGMRIYDPRVVRFLSTDPITKNYADLTPYQYASNSPIWCIDLDGLEGIVASPLGNQNVISVQTASKAANAISNWVASKHQEGIRNVSIAESARLTAIKQGRPDGDGINWYVKSLVYLGPWWNETAPLSHANDGSVLMTGKNLDNSDASTVDYFAAGIGIFTQIPGNELKKGGSALIEGFIKVFKNGKEVEEAAYKIGKYGHKGTKEYNSILKAVQSGGNIVANTKDEALQFLKESFPGIADETGKATASKFGYRIDKYVDKGKGGLKQGHQGLHINYYDKENKIEGAILIDGSANPQK